MATDSRFKMSQERYDALKEELQYLETDKAKEVSEDEADDIEKDIQKLTDKYIAEVDKAIEAKSKEVMTV